jgi:hypothetical protein
MEASKQYQLIQAGKIIGSYQYFFEAWIKGIELPCFARILGPDGEWITRPRLSN